MRAAVLGSPIAHSLSPVLHRAAYAALGLDWTYDAIECTESDLQVFLARCARDPAWAGLSLTMPLKRAAFALVDSLDEPGRLTGAVNTVVFAGGTVAGHNTDVFGIALALRELALPSTVGSTVGATFGSVVVLGGGGTARAALAAVSGWSPARLVLVVRRPEAGEELRDLAAAALPGTTFEVHPWSSVGEAVAGADLVVSTVPAGVTDGLAAQGWPGRAALLDVLYAPWPTRLARAAAGAGATVVGGLPVLVAQAALAVELMTGRSAPLVAMHQAGERALA